MKIKFLSLLLFFIISVITWAFACFLLQSASNGNFIVYDGFGFLISLLSVISTFIFYLFALLLTSDHFERIITILRLEEEESNRDPNEDDQ